MKNPFKRKKNPIPKIQTPPPEPRTKDEIQADVDKLFKLIGESEYQVYVHTETLKALNQRMVGHAREMQARKELDEATAKEGANNGELQS